MPSLPVTFSGDRLRVHFDRFDIDAYDRFLQVKQLPEFEIDFDADQATYTITAPRRFAGLLGETLPDRGAGELPLKDFLYDDQAAIVRMALECKRFACWSMIGGGKTLIQLEFARHAIHRTGQRALIVTLNDIVPQTIEMCRQFYGNDLPIHRIESRRELRDFSSGKLDTGASLGITNYEKFNPDEEGQTVNEVRQLGCLIVDENRLKGGGAKQKWAIIHSSKGIEYKLSCTATPAPNETIEFASQASFLERMRGENEIIWTYFQRDEVSHRWVIKRHARKAFFEFMAGWSIYVADPRAYGWRKDFPDVPPPQMLIHEVPITAAQQRELQKFSVAPSGQLSMFRNRQANAIERGKLSQIAKGFRYVKRNGVRRVKSIESKKPATIANLAVQDFSRELQGIIWTLFDEEADILSAELTDRGLDHALLTGRTKRSDREKILEQFRSGKIPWLITRGSMLGYGMNFQHVGSMIFSGWNDSFETYVQAIGRAVRHGQQRSVRIHLPLVRELEGDQLENVLAKQERHRDAVAEMQQNYIDASRRLRGVA